MQTAPHITELSQKNLGAPFSSVQGKGIYISFQWDMLRLKTIDPEKNGTRVRRLRLMRQPIGDPNTQSSTYITPEKAKEHYPAEWEYFTKHGDMPVTGTALSELPGISVSQIQIMQLSGLRSIEDVLGVQQEVVDRIGHEGRIVRSVAEEWQKRSDENIELTDYAELKAAQDTALTAANSRAERAEASNASLQARLEALETMMNSGAGHAPQMGGHAQMGGPVPPNSMGNMNDNGPDIDSTPNPLAEGDGTLDDDPLA